jgi:hypothetical protein
VSRRRLRRLRLRRLGRMRRLRLGLGLGRLLPVVGRLRPLLELERLGFTLVDTSCLDGVEHRRLDASAAGKRTGPALAARMRAPTP